MHLETVGQAPSSVSLKRLFLILKKIMNNSQEDNELRKTVVGRHGFATVESDFVS